MISYIIGSIPFGYLIVRLTAGADVRDTGSGGTGATNVTRRAGKMAGVLTLILDVFKGAAAVAVARSILGLSIFAQGAHIGPSLPNAGWWVAIAGVAAIVGHCFPIWLGFRGGKGVATGVGVFFMMAPWAVADEICFTWIHHRNGHASRSDSPGAFFDQTGGGISIFDIRRFGWWFVNHIHASR